MPWTSLAMQWLILYHPMQRVGVQSLVRKLRSHMLCSQKSKSSVTNTIVTTSIKILKNCYISKKNLGKKKKKPCAKHTVASTLSSDKLGKNLNIQYICTRTGFFFLIIYFKFSQYNWTCRFKGMGDYH